MFQTVSRYALILCLSTAPAVTDHRPIREVGDLGLVVTDIDSHLPAGHPYRDSDRITWTHEGTHGINSLLRNKYGCSGFYVLENRAVLIQEPATTLAAVAHLVPLSLRGEVYNLYLVQMRGYWNEQPTYVFDEWIAYTNGTEARQRLGIQDRAETVRYMLEFCVYATCVPQAAGSHDPQMRAFIVWQIERAMVLYRASGITSDYLTRLRTAPDAESLRHYMRDYFGTAWTHRVLGL
jgi:hypothetical protein